jgi:hypothetical protein
MSDEMVAAPIKKRRPRASEQEKAQWAERYYQPGLTQKQFAHQRGIADSTLQRWVAENPRPGQAVAIQREAGLLPAFAELKLPVSPTMPDWAAELCRPNGVILRAATDLPAALLEQLLAVC